MQMRDWSNSPTDPTASPDKAKKNVINLEYDIFSVWLVKKGLAEVLKQQSSETSTFKAENDSLKRMRNHAVTVCSTEQKENP